MPVPTLSKDQIRAFINDGFLRIDDAFSGETAAAARTILWSATGCDPDYPSTWTRPVIRLGGYSQEPFREAANAPRLLAAYDQLAGPGRWQPLYGLGTFPVRFPSTEDPGDTGWHVDASFPGDDPADFMSARINVQSRGRAMLMLFLFSDLGEHDASTRIRPGSHRDVARILAPAREAGLSFMELAGRLDPLPGRETVFATGPAGTVYLCHPFLVHAAQMHNGSVPRFMAQPPLLPSGPVVAEDASADASPVEIAIRQALG
ncbi:MAG: phytanoyl-CoA dioxygenase [Dehalococcoidia bacterium]